MQNPTYQRLIAGLAETVPPSCWWIPNEVAIANLGISQSTRKRDTRLLTALGVMSEKGKRKGYTRDEYAALVMFRAVQDMADRDVASNDIKQLTEDFKNYDNSRTDAA
jgi:hypothetical protein